jgi:hypothetical protein
MPRENELKCDMQNDTHYSVMDAVSKWTQLAGCLWLTPVTLATVEAAIRRISVRDQPRVIVP